MLLQLFVKSVDKTVEIFGHLLIALLSKIYLRKKARHKYYEILIYFFKLHGFGHQLHFNFRLQMYLQLLNPAV